MRVADYWEASRLDFKHDRAFAWKLSRYWPDGCRILDISQCHFAKTLGETIGTIDVCCIAPDEARAQFLRASSYLTVWRTTTEISGAFDVILRVSGDADPSQYLRFLRPAGKVSIHARSPSWISRTTPYLSRRIEALTDRWL